MRRDTVNQCYTVKRTTRDRIKLARILMGERTMDRALRLMADRAIKAEVDRARHAGLDPGAVMADARTKASRSGGRNVLLTVGPAPSSGTVYEH